MGMPLRKILHLPSEVDATVLFEGVLQFREYEQTVLELAVDVSVIRKREGAGVLVPRHHPSPDRVNSCAKADHLERVALLPARGTRDVVHLPLVIDIPKRTCCVLHSSEIREESPQPWERWQIVSDLHLAIVVLARSFTSDDVKSRLPKGLVERVFEINFEESPDSTLRDGSIVKELQNLGAD